MKMETGKGKAENPVLRVIKDGLEFDARFPAAGQVVPEVGDWWIVESYSGTFYAVQLFPARETLLTATRICGEPLNDREPSRLVRRLCTAAERAALEGGAG